VQHSPGARSGSCRSSPEVERAIRALARRFGLTPEDLKLDLGPLGRRVEVFRTGGYC
jgi:hypothetical protein